jgi:hypothetical protein
VPAFIPASPQDLSPEWVTDAMRGAGALPAGRVSELEIQTLTDGGTGFTGDTVRVRLTYEGADDGPDSVIAKFPTSDLQTRGMLEQFDAYAREIRFYQRFAHRMPCPTPTFLGADYDAKGARGTGPTMSKLVDALPDRVQLIVTSDVRKFMRPTKRRYALLIEDLGAETTVYDMAAPPNESQIADALSVLASVHGAFWGDPSLEGDTVFRPIITTTPGLYQTVGRKRCLPLAQERWAHWLNDSHLAQFHEALDRFPADVAMVNEKVTMIHGDPRSDNILYRADGQVVLLDWALVGHAHPGYDVAYLLSSSILPTENSSRNALVEGYGSALAERGCEVDGVALRAVIDATYRSLLVQQLMSIAVLNNESYGDESMYDLWIPRILAGLADGW